MAPLQLVKEHLPGDIVDILERLGKAYNIPFNQLYYIAKNCTDRYYSKVIETFVAETSNHGQTTSFGQHC